MDIRFAEESDAAGMLALYKALDSETEFMFFEPGERNTTVEEIKTRIRGSVASDSFALCVAVDHGTVVGFSAGFSSVGDRNRHVVRLVVGVCKSSWGNGIGRQMIRAVEAWALGRQKSKMELTVMVDNDRAVRLYESEGFEKEGVKRRSVKLKSGYQDELHMGKLLD